MTPNFNDKDFVLSLNCFYSINRGDVVLVKIPNIGIVIKRVGCIENNKIKLHGDNHEYKSKIYDDFFDLNLVQGKVFFKF
tara:strand:- start:2179 stop:2418 length:240 start_codon:yes stop_codon:yes gene_type:complete